MCKGPSLISQGLEDAGIDVKHAGEEGDADVIIVRKVLAESFTSKAPIKEVADDTYTSPPSLCNIRNLIGNQATYTVYK